LHISKLARGKQVKHSRDVLSPDAQLEVRIEKIDQPNKRISLDLAGNEKETSAGEKEDLSGYIAKASENMGTLGDVFKKAGKKR
jgi:small subunit ribosomal protein S1